MELKDVKVVALLLCIASGLCAISCNGCSYKFTKPSTCLRDGAPLEVIITSHFEGPQNDNVITAKWYKRNREDISNWEVVGMLPTKYRNPYYSRDIGNGTKEIAYSLKIFGVSETDSGCYLCEICVTYVQCAPPGTEDPTNVRCLRDVEQCLDASSALVCSGSVSLAVPPSNISATTSPSPAPFPGIVSDGDGGATSQGGVTETALYGGIAVCLVLAITSLLLTIVIVVLCVNKSNGKRGTRKTRHDDRTRAAVGTGYRSPAGDTLLTNIISDGTLSSSGASSSCSATLLTIPLFNGVLTPSPSAHAGESTFNIGPGSAHLLKLPNQFSGGSNCAPADIAPVDHSAHPRSPRQSSNDSNPQSLKRDAGAPRLGSPSSALSPTPGTIHHYHVLELRPVSEVGSDTATQTREDSWGAINLSLHQGLHEKALQLVQPRHCECAESALTPEKGLFLAARSVAADSCRYTKLDVSTLGPKHDYAKRSIQADSAQLVDECTI